MTFRMPAEWERQSAVWLAWPHNKEDWPGKFDSIQWVYCEVIKHITTQARVRLLVKNEAMQAKVKATLTMYNIDNSKVDFIVIATDRSWLRDSAPTVVYDSQKRTLLEWKFNAWAKYNNWKRDAKVPGAVQQFLDLPTMQPMHKGKRIVLEGGAIEVNGKGTMLTSEECFLSKIQCRNPGFTRADYEEVFAKYFGTPHTIWLGDGIKGDDTHGHIDDLARFVNATTVVTVVEGNKKHDNYHALNDNLKRLKKAHDQDGKKLNVIELPTPQDIIFDGQLLPASYTNFLIVNKIVLAPIFNDINDRIALNTLTNAFPRHEIIPIYCGDFILGLGTIHCASQQEPVESSASPSAWK